MSELLIRYYIIFPTPDARCSSDTDCTGFPNTGEEQELCVASPTFTGRRCMTRLQEQQEIQEALANQQQLFQTGESVT